MVFFIFILQQMGKSISLIVLFIVVSLLMQAEQFSAPEVLKVGVYDNPPKIFTDDSGNPDGIFIDIIESVYSPRKIRVEYVSGKWSDLFRMLQKGEIDVLPDMAFSPERDSLFHLSVPVLSSWLQVYTSSSSIINQPADLQGKRIGVLRSSNQEEYVKVAIKRDFDVDYRVITFDTYTQSVEALKNNEIDALIADRLKTAFLQNLSHEIRTPLNGILGFVNVLQDPHFNDESKNQFTEIINSSSDRLLSTINDIVEISKIDAHQVEVNRTSLNLMDILQQHIGQLKEKAAKKGVTLTLNHQLTSENASIEADAVLLNGVISRLLNNALKFTSEGSIELGAYPEGSYRIVFVKDTGMGIPADRLEAIFDRFVNADLKLSRSYDGSGLGLAIVKSYLELMNGSSWVESEVGKGSTFYCKLPVS